MRFSGLSMNTIWILFKSSFQLLLQDFWSTAVFSQTNRKNKFQGSFSVNECCVMLRPILLFPEELTIILVLLHRCLNETNCIFFRVNFSVLPFVFHPSSDQEKVEHDCSVRGTT